MDNRREFYFKGVPVGHFEDGTYPHMSGRHRYMPYRSVGHYNMTLTLETGPASCSFREADTTFDFLVLSVPEYGVLEIGEIRGGSGDE